MMTRGGRRMWKEHAFRRGEIVSDPERGEAYRVIELIGSGSYAEVYKAACVRTGALYALKVLHLHRAGSSRARERHRREGALLLRVRHPNVVQVHAVITSDDGRVVMVMDLLVGRTLAQLRADCGGTLPINIALELMIQACGALQAVHSHKVVHRDIKPDNMFVREDGHLLLCDLGASQFPHERRITSDDHTIGTVEYMSPEQLYKPELLGPRSDLFALGVVLYEAIAGVSPFAVNGIVSRDLKELGLRIILQPHVPLKVAAPRTPDDLAIIIERLLAKDPGERYESAAALRVLLDAALQGYLEELAQRKQEPVRISFVGRLPPVPQLHTHELSLPPASPNPFVSISVPPIEPENDERTTVPLAHANGAPEPVREPPPAGDGIAPLGQSADARRRLVRVGPAGTAKMVAFMESPADPTSARASPLRIAGLPTTLRLPVVVARSGDDAVEEARAASLPPQPTPAAIPSEAPAPVASRSAPLQAAAAALTANEDLAARVSVELAERPTTPWRPAGPARVEAWARSDAGSQIQATTADALSPEVPSAPAVTVSLPALRVAGREAASEPDITAGTAIEAPAPSEPRSPSSLVREPSRALGVRARARRWVERRSFLGIPAWLVVLGSVGVMLTTGEVTYYVSRQRTAGAMPAQPAPEQPAAGGSSTSAPPLPDSAPEPRADVAPGLVPSAAPPGAIGAPATASEPTSRAPTSPGPTAIPTAQPPPSVRAPEKPSSPARPHADASPAPRQIHPSLPQPRRAPTAPPRAPGRLFGEEQ